MNTVVCTLGNSGLYVEKNVDKVSDELMILSSFLNDDIGDSSEAFKECISKMEEGEYEFLNLTSIQKKNSNIEMDFQFIDNLQKLTLPIETLIKLIDTWVALVKAKTKEIIITEENGEYTIKAGNTK